MVIKRIVNGTEMEFELTDQEIFHAYEEQEHRWDLTYVSENCCDHTLLERAVQNLTMQDKDNETMELFHAIAYEMRDFLDEGYELPDAFIEACDSYFEKLDKEANPYPAILYLAIDKLGEDENGQACAAGCTVNFGNYPKEIPYNELSENLNKESLINIIGMSGYLSSEDITVISKEEYMARFGDDKDFREKEA